MRCKAEEDQEEVQGEKLYLESKAENIVRKIAIRKNRSPEIFKKLIGITQINHLQLS